MGREPPPAGHYTKTVHDALAISPDLDKENGPLLAARFPDARECLAAGRRNELGVAVVRALPDNDRVAVPSRGTGCVLVRRHRDDLARLVGDRADSGLDHATGCDV